MTGGTGGRLTSPAYRLVNHVANPASTWVCRLLMLSCVLFRGGVFLIVSKEDQLRPTAGEMEPVPVSGVFGRNG